MTKKQLIIIPLAVGAVAVAGFSWVNTSYAQDSDSYPPIVQKLVDRFNLNPDEVQEVFDEAHQERHEQHLLTINERLDEAVENGDITQQQKQAILDKMDEHQADIEALKDMSPEERRQWMADHKQELINWAQDNDIDLKQLYLKAMFGKGMGKGFGRGMHHGFGWDKPTEAN